MTKQQLENLLKKGSKFATEGIEKLGETAQEVDIKALENIFMQIPGMEGLVESLKHTPNVEGAKSKMPTFNDLTAKAASYTAKRIKEEEEAKKAKEEKEALKLKVMVDTKVEEFAHWFSKESHKAVEGGKKVITYTFSTVKPEDATIVEEAIVSMLRSYGFIKVDAAIVEGKTSIRIELF